MTNKSRTYEQLRDLAAEKWTKKYPWEKFMYEDKCGMSAKKQAERPSDIPSNLENAFRAGADWQHERTKGLVQALRVIEYRLFGMDGIERICWERARQALAEYEGSSHE